jgi:hypothetical protein
MRMARSRAHALVLVAVACTDEPGPVLVPAVVAPPAEPTPRETAPEFEPPRLAAERVEITMQRLRARAAPSTRSDRPATAW